MDLKLEDMVPVSVDVQLIGGQHYTLKALIEKAPRHGNNGSFLDHREHEQRLRELNGIKLYSWPKGYFRALASAEVVSIMRANPADIYKGAQPWCAEIQEFKGIASQDITELAGSICSLPEFVDGEWAVAKESRFSRNRLVLRQSFDLEVNFEIAYDYYHLEIGPRQSKIVTRVPLSALSALLSYVHKYDVNGWQELLSLNPDLVTLLYGIQPTEARRLHQNDPLVICATVQFPGEVPSGIMQTGYKINPASPDSPHALSRAIYVVKQPEYAPAARSPDAGACMQRA